MGKCRALVSIVWGCQPLTRRESCSPQKQLHISRQRGKRSARKLVGAGGGAGAVADRVGVVPVAGRVESTKPTGGDLRAWIAKYQLSASGQRRHANAEDRAAAGAAAVLAVGDQSAPCDLRAADAAGHAGDVEFAEKNPGGNPGADHRPRSDRGLPAIDLARAGIRVGDDSATAGAGVGAVSVPGGLELHAGIDRRVGIHRARADDHAGRVDLYVAVLRAVRAGFRRKHSWHALLFSRDLMRKRFFKVAIRIVVFLA